MRRLRCFNPILGRGLHRLLIALALCGDALLAYENFKGETAAANESETATVRKRPTADVDTSARIASAL